MSAQLCPWCQMEIVWDPEIGPENECPHCYNELKDYRTVTIAADDELDEEQELEDYDQAVHQLTRSYDSDSMDCDTCGEAMLPVGLLTVDEGQFAPLAGPTRVPYLPPPYQMQVHLCPYCFQMKHFLTDEGRASFVQAIAQSKK